MEKSVVHNSVSTTDEFLLQIERHETKCLYRGQANSQWRVDCSAVRRLMSVSDTTIDPNLVGRLLVAYLNDLLKRASRHIGPGQSELTGYSDLEVLAQLQHFGAATGLIDFTLEPLIALWFACNECPRHTGAVFALSRSSVREFDDIENWQNRGLSYFYNVGLQDWDHPPYLWQPKAVTQRRIVSQHSVFVLGVPFIWPALLRKIEIDNQSKGSLLEELRTEHGITEESLFDDISGFSKANSVSTPLNTVHVVHSWEDQLCSSSGCTISPQTHVDCGLVYAAVKQYLLAISCYSKAIEMDPNHVGAYLNRGCAYQELNEHVKALGDFNYGIAKWEQLGDNRTERQIASAYWQRGTTHRALGREELGYKDYNKAIDLGLRWYFTEDGRFSSYPESMDNYKTELI